MKRLTLCALYLFASAGFAHATFVPESEIQWKHLTDGPSNITENEFKSVVAKLQNAYAPMVKQHGGNLSINGDWKSDKLNAGARQMMGSWQVVISGAIARRPELSLDGLTLIICHEIGHHLGGYAFSQGGNPFEKTWAANEGQSDYFSTQVCAHKMWKDEKEKNASYRSTVPEYVKVRCDSAWGSTEEQDLCYRSGAATETVMNTMAALMNKPKPQFETPDRTIVDKTSSAHPPVQCRMDTIFQASLCATERSEAVIPGKTTAGGPFAREAEREAMQNSCSQKTQPFGYRPSCWFKAQF